MVDSGAAMWYNIGAKVGRFSTKWTDFLFTRTRYIISQRPSVVTVGSAFARDLSYDAGGRTILDPWHAVGPPEIKKRQTG
jgi:hypothetical protein